MRNICKLKWCYEYNAQEDFIQIDIYTIITFGHFKTSASIFFLYIKFTQFQTKNLLSPGTYISKRTWDPSEKAIIK